MTHFPLLTHFFRKIFKIQTVFFLNNVWKIGASREGSTFSQFSTSNSKIESFEDENVKTEPLSDSEFDDKPEFSGNLVQFKLNQK